MIVLAAEDCCIACSSEHVVFCIDFFYRFCHDGLLTFPRTDGY